jgi:hypothetical protein
MDLLIAQIEKDANFKNTQNVEIHHAFKKMKNAIKCAVDEYKAVLDDYSTLLKANIIYHQTLLLQQSVEYMSLN